VTSALPCADGSPSVLVVEHDFDVASPLVEQLLTDGYRARLGRTIEHARALARAQPPGIVLVGELPSCRAALELLLEIRGGSALGSSSGSALDGTRRLWSNDLPVIVMSSRTCELDLLRAFDAGADDFLARPPSYLELRARLHALLARTARARGPQPVVEVGPLVINLAAHVAYLHGRPLQLPRLEYELLLHLAREPRRVFAKQELLRAVWDHAAALPTRTLDSHSSRLRCKLRAAGCEHWVVNVRGVGYRLI
jgi:DNA-binding response OmpR family regulator